MECLTDRITWISTDDELPEYKLPTLFWVNDRNINPGCYVGWYSKEFDYWFDIHGHIMNDISHWCPLPKGPDCTLRIGLKIYND